MPKPCGEPILNFGACAEDRAPRLRSCRWHWLARQPIAIQETYAKDRASRGDPEKPDREMAKFALDRGMRWCSDCGCFIPLFYATGSKCKAHASMSAHASRVERVYRISRDDYDALYEFQQGRCYICRRRATRRLAVDHDHVTDEVRGLLCPDQQRGCNFAVLGNLEAHSMDGGLAAARRLVEYLENPPMAQLGRHMVDNAPPF